MDGSGIRKAILQGGSQYTRRGVIVRRSTERENQPQAILGTVRNATLLLQLLGEGPAFQQLKELAERSNMSPATVHRLLRSLALAGLVDQDKETSRYSLGSELVRLAERYLARLPTLQVLAPYLPGLRDSTNATIEVMLLVSGSVIEVARAEAQSTDELRRPQRWADDPVNSAAGRLLLAHANGNGSGARHADPRAGSKQEPPTLSRSDLKNWSGDFVVLENQALETVEVAVPVADSRGRVVAALSATASTAVLTPEMISRKVVPQLQRVAGHAVTNA